MSVMMLHDTWRYRSVRLFTLFVAALFSVQSLACTTLSLRSNSGAVVSIMNMEFPDNLGYTLNHIPANHTITAAAFKGIPGKQWRSLYRVIGTGGKSDPQAIGAGINEQGLYVTGLYLGDKTRYAEVQERDAGNFIQPSLLPTYLLTQFQSVAQVKQALREIVVGQIPASGFYNVVPTYHWMVTDRDYNSLVIEFTDGELKLYDNPYHALSNAPTFDYHLNNMRSYTHLNSAGYAPQGETPATGVGYGTLGLPGDYTPTGRFVRAAFLARHSESSDESIMRQAAEVSNALIYPAGIAVYNSHFTQQPVSQKTMYAFIANAQTGEVLFRRYGDLSWRPFHFNDFEDQSQITLLELFDDWSMQ